MTNTGTYRLKSQAIEDIYANSTFAVLISVFFAALLSFSLWQYAEHQNIIYWLCANVIATTLHAFLHLKFKNTSPEKRDPQTWEKIIMYSFGLRALAFGSGGVLLFSHNTVALTILMMVLAGLVSGAVSSYHMMKPISNAYVIFNLSPLIYSLFACGQDGHSLLATIGIIYMASMVVITQKLNRGYTSNVTLRINNETLTNEWVNTFDSVQDIILVLDKEHRIIKVNQYALRKLNKAREELIGRHCYEVFQCSELPLESCPKRERLEEGESYSYELFEQSSNKYLQVSVYPTISDEGELIGFVHITRDITEFKDKENELEEVITQRELLLQEIHHRVKNNLSVIQSLLDLQTSNAKDITEVNALKESQSRIMAMGMIHEKLYQSSDFSTLNFKEYISDLAVKLLETYSINKNISLSFDVPKLTVNIEIAIAYGLIINELITNSMKYAFPDGQKGEIFIGVESDEFSQKFLVVRDNGIGFSKGDDILSSNTIGMTIIKELTRQIGSIAYFHSDNNGSEFRTLLGKTIIPIRQWNDIEHLTGSETIDSEHKYLYDSLKKLRDAIESGKHDEGMSDIAPRILQHIDEHFKTEEVIMSQYDYPAFDEHKEAHEGFIVKCQSTMAKYQDGKTWRVFSLYEFLLNWFTNHIWRLDIELGKFMQEKGLINLADTYPKGHMQDKSGCQILTIEDDRLTQKMMSRFLQKNGYDFVAVSSGIEALNAVQKHRFELIISDVMLPDISGIETLKRLNENEIDTPVLFLTGNNLHKADKELESLNVIDVLFKPVSFPDLKQVLSEFFEKNRTESHSHNVAKRV